MSDKLWHPADGSFPESEAYEVGNLLVVSERKKGFALLWAVLTGRPKYKKKIWVCKS